MAKLITILWRDIPSQVVAKRGRQTLKRKLSPRFQIAIDRAAMRAGKGSSSAYIEEWRRESRRCRDDLDDEMATEVAHLEDSFSDDRLAELVKLKGIAAAADE